MNIKRLLFINENISSTLRTEINNKRIKTGTSKTAVIDISKNATFNDISGSITGISSPLERIGFLYHNSCQGVLPYLLDNLIIEETFRDISVNEISGNQVTQTYEIVEKTIDTSFGESITIQEISGTVITPSYEIIETTVSVPDINSNFQEHNYFSNELLTLIDYLKTNYNFQGVIDIITCKTSDDLKPYFSEIENTKGVTINYTPLLIGYDDLNDNSFNKLNDLSGNEVDIVSTYFSSNPFQAVAQAPASEILLLLLGPGDITLTGSVNGTFYLDQDYIDTNITTIRLTGTTINENKIELSGNVILPNDIRFVLDNSSNNVFTFEGSNNLITITDYTATNLYPGLIYLEQESSINLQNINIDASGVIYLDTLAGSLIQSNPFATRKVHKSIYVNNCNNSGLNITNNGCGGLLGLACGYRGSLFIENCHNDLNISGQDSGGLLGQQAGQAAGVIIKNCYNTGTLFGAYSGGIAGTFFCSSGINGLLMQNCYNTGLIRGGSCGGLVGYGGLYNITDNSAFYIIENCYNTGQISFVSSSGGICARQYGAYNNSSNIIIRNCYNTGIIFAVFCGGIVGYQSFRNSPNYPLIENCYNTGDIIGSYSGGIVCTSSAYQGSVKIKECYNTGTITNIYSGGITGRWTGEQGKVIIEDCYNTGTVQGISSGGIGGASLGYNSISVVVKNCNNSGDINGNQSGGIVGSWTGELTNNLLIENCYNTGAINGNNSCGIIPWYSALNATNALIKDCYNTGLLSGFASAGICTDGTFENITNGKIENCYNTGNMINSSCGGICGLYFSNNGTTIIENCYNTGYMTGNTCGGIVGFGSGNTSNSNILINKCYNTGYMTGIDCGGITAYNCGVNATSFRITNCFNRGSIYNSYCCGIAGKKFCENAVYGSIENCYSRIYTRGYRSSGIAGERTAFNAQNFLINNCYSLANIDTAATESGGLVSSDFGAGNSVTSNITVKNSYYTGIIIANNTSDLIGPIISINSKLNLRIENCYCATTRWDGFPQYSSTIGSIINIPNGISSYSDLNIISRFNYGNDYNLPVSNQCIHANYNLELLANGKIDSKLNYPNGAYIADTLNLTDSAGYPLLKVFRDNVTWNSDYYTYYSGIPQYGVGSISRYYNKSQYRYKVLKMQTTNVPNLFMNNLIHKTVDYENITKQHLINRDRSSLTRLERLKYRRAYNLLRK